MVFERMREIREEFEDTQQNIADKLEISKGTYSMNEAGHDTITLVNLIKFCDIYGVSVDFILELTDVREYKNSKTSFDRDILKDRLKKLRKENKYTQQMMGDILHIDHSVWCRYEQGVTIIQTTFLYTICKKFNVSADYLLGRTNEIKILKVLVLNK